MPHNFILHISLSNPLSLHSEIPLQRTSEIKNLGVYYSSSLSSNKNIDITVGKY